MKPKPYYEEPGITIYHADCRDILPHLEPVDLILTDPPYGLNFMGKDWDRGVPGVHFWELILNASKPGCYLMAFGGTRTFHRLACAIEDAGWEIRDTVMWVYGSGFPKSLDVSKAIDKEAGKVGTRGDYISRDHAIKRKPGNERMHEGYQRPWRDDPELEDRNARVYIPATETAKQWEGWGTALKPAVELICLARKPLEKGLTVAQNVLKYGTGALNIDGCRVITGGEWDEKHTNRPKCKGIDYGITPGGKTFLSGDIRSISNIDISRGRFPANLIHDGSEEVVGMFPATHKAGNIRPCMVGKNFWYGKERKQNPNFYKDSGSAARFFYCAKASRSERGEGNTHPTVKPLALLQYLIKLGLPPGGVVLDPFVGSGSTLVAAQKMGCKAIGIELGKENCDIGVERLKREVLI